MARETWSQDEIDACLTALIAWTGNAAAACRYLDEEGKRHPSPGALLTWSRTLHWERYEKLRELWSARVEESLANDMRDAARAAIEAVRLATEKAVERLEAGKDDDPGRTAANLSRVAQSGTDKLMSLTGRPTQITESRDASEILRALIAKHPQVFGMTAAPEEPAAIEEAAEA